MNFFERIRTGRLFFKKKNPDPTTTTERLPKEPALLGKDSKKADISAIKTHQPANTQKQLPEMPDRVVRFTFMDRTYILEAFELNFNQELNAKGLPGGFPRGGIMTITMSEPPNYYIQEWMAREELQRDGLIQIFPNKKKIDEGADLVISFKDAYCIRYNKKIDILGAGLLTTIVISPRTVKIGNEEFTNRWKKQDPLPYYIRSN